MQYYKACYEKRLEDLGALIAVDKKKLMNKSDVQGWTALHVLSFMNKIDHIDMTYVISMVDDSDL